jgi:hypothetical protein
MIQGWPRTRVEMCGSSASLIVTAKPKAKEHFRIAEVLLFYILQNISWSKSTCFSKVYYHALFSDPAIRYGSFDPASSIRATSVPYFLFNELKDSGVGGVLI